MRRGSYETASVEKLSRLGCKMSLENLRVDSLVPTAVFRAGLWRYLWKHIINCLAPNCPGLGHGTFPIRVWRTPEYSTLTHHAPGTFSLLVAFQGNKTTLCLMIFVCTASPDCLLCSTDGPPFNSQLKWSLPHLKRPAQLSNSLQLSTSFSLLYGTQHSL